MSTFLQAVVGFIGGVILTALVIPPVIFLLLDYLDWLADKFGR
jgi:TM2 domain-containing membrane protein YozV